MEEEVRKQKECQKIRFSSLRNQFYKPLGMIIIISSKVKAVGIPTWGMLNLWFSIPITSSSFKKLTSIQPKKNFECLCGWDQKGEKNTINYDFCTEPEICYPIRKVRIMSTWQMPDTLPLPGKWLILCLNLFVSSISWALVENEDLIIWNASKKKVLSFISSNLGLIEFSIFSKTQHFLNSENLLWR